MVTDKNLRKTSTMHRLSDHSLQKRQEDLVAQRGQAVLSVWWGRCKDRFTLSERISKIRKYKGGVLSKKKKTEREKWPLLLGGVLAAKYVLPQQETPSTIHFRVTISFLILYFIFIIIHFSLFYLLSVDTCIVFVCLAILKSHWNLTNTNLVTYLTTLLISK